MNGKRRTRERGLHGSGGQGGGRDGHETDNGGDGGQGGSAVGGDGDPAEDEVRVAERLGVTVREVRRRASRKPKLVRGRGGVEAQRERRT